MITLRTPVINGSTKKKLRVGREVGVFHAQEQNALVAVISASARVLAADIIYYARTSGDAAEMFPRMIQRERARSCEENAGAHFLGKQYKYIYMSRREDVRNLIFSCTHGCEEALLSVSSPDLSYRVKTQNPLPGTV